MTPAPSDWLDEIELDPTVPAVTMGIRALGDRPWLLVDERRAAELSLKQSLLAQRHDEVFAALAGTEGAGAAVVALLRRHGVDVAEDRGRHPLERAGLSVQEDLCLLRRRHRGWHLEAASLSFPSRWRLADKMGRHVTEVHAPVEGYRERLAPKVDAFLNRLGERPSWRRNWFVHADPALFQPSPPVGGDPIVPAAEAGDRLVVRSERQTLRALGRFDGSAWVLFTIRIQQASIGELLTSPERARAFGRYLDEASEAELAHRGMAPAQVTELRRALAMARDTRRDPGRGP